METNINKVKYMFEFLTTLNRLVNNLKRENYLLSGGNVIADDMIISYSKDDDIMESIMVYDAKKEKDVRKYGNKKIDNFMNITEDIDSINIILNVANVEEIYKLKKYLVAYSIAEDSITFHLITDEVESTMVFGVKNDMSIEMNGSFEKEMVVSKELDQAVLDRINLLNTLEIEFKNDDDVLKAIYPYSELIVKNKLSKYNKITLMVLAGYGDWSFELVSLQNVMKQIAMFTVESIFRYVRY